MDDYGLRLRDHYRTLSTDELLAIRVGSIELTEIAALLLDEELQERKVTTEDFADAKEAQAMMAEDRDANTVAGSAWTVFRIMALLGFR